jgi:hypothetical protein
VWRSGKNLAAGIKTDYWENEGAAFAAETG